MIDYQQMQRWGVLLVAGGLYDQPSWTWEIINLAGLMWEDMTMAQRAEEAVVGDDEQPEGVL